MTSGDETDAQWHVHRSYTGRPNTISLENSVLEPAGRMTESNVNTVTVTQISVLHRVSNIVLLATIVVGAEVHRKLFRGSLYMLIQFTCNSNILSMGPAQCEPALHCKTTVLCVVVVLYELGEGCDKSLCSFSRFSALIR